MQPTWQDVPDELQRRILEGDTTALDPFARWVHDSRPGHVSDDVLQGVLAAVLRLVTTDSGKSSLKTIRSLPKLLATIARRRRLDEVRGARRFRELRALIAQSAKESANDPEGRAAAIEFRDQIWRKLLLLRPLEREALLRAVVNGEPYREIAGRIWGAKGGGRADRRLAVVIARARKKLRARLREIWPP